MSFDLLSTVEYGGCSAKLDPIKLGEILGDLPKIMHPNLMVGIDTHDDAGVYKLNDETALIFTTDFFPPVCSDAYQFGQIAAANALSDIYAMGGSALMVLNLTMFSSKEIPMEVLKEILQGGQSKVAEAGAIVMGGHTIEDHPPKYGLAVLGTVHPDKLITNANAVAGEILILTKPLGVGVLIAAKRLDMVADAHYQKALDNMKQLNMMGCKVMQHFGVRAATDVTGFGLLGHALKMAEASGVSFKINSLQLPVLDGVDELLSKGCIPGGAFRNLKFVGDAIHFSADANYNRKMVACDAQTSGGLFFSIKPHLVNDALQELQNNGINGVVVGDVIPKSGKDIYFL